MSVTRDDVARHAGVSPAVVSYVVNNGPRPVAASTRERVLASIAELGYRPDVVARQLRTGRSQSLGLVLPSIDQPYFAEMTQQLTRLSYVKGYQLLVASTEWSFEQERRQLQGLVERRVDGIILMSVDPLQDFGVVESWRVPMVVIDRPEVAVKGAEAATRHLIQHGHKRIAYVSGRKEFVANRRRRDGWAGALAAAGLRVPDSYVVHRELSRPGGYEAAGYLLRLPSPPSAVYFESDSQAVGFIRAATDLGVEVPVNLAVVSSEGTAMARFAVPSLTTIEQPMTDIAEEALAAVLGSGPSGVQLLTNAEYHLVRRESCGCVIAPVD